MNLTAHLRVTAEMNGVKIVNQPGLTTAARAWSGHRVVAIGTIDSEVDYLVALHEIGHVVLGHVGEKGKLVSRMILRTEVEAWQWALKHKRCPLTQAGVDEIRSCLDSYARAARNPNHANSIRAWLATLEPDKQMAMAGPRGRLP